MPKPPPGRQPDPMAREVDRLLAQLAGHDAEPSLHRSGPRGAVGGSTAATSAKRWTRYRGAAAARDRAGAELAGLWARLILVVALGAAIVWWPYARACDLPLAGYLGAVAMVLVGGAWCALAAWRIRAGLAHLVALAVVFWGAVLFASQLLPRTGYAAEHAVWRCPAGVMAPQ
ncbi:MAG TPA: hypothetical protein VFW66_07060 [Gemmatimonadales bacterium]|nr:hypothetical protein [Gemmatimonadales bacterium]